MCRQTQPTPTSIFHLPDPSSRVGVVGVPVRTATMSDKQHKKANPVLGLLTQEIETTQCARVNEEPDISPNTTMLPRTETALLGPTARPSALQEWATGVMAPSGRSFL